LNLIFKYLKYIKGFIVRSVCSLEFCGFVFTRDKTFIRKRITKNMRRKCFKFNKNPTKHNAQSMLSYYGWVKHTDSYILYKKYFNLKLLKEAL